MEQQIINKQKSSWLDSVDSRWVLSTEWEAKNIAMLEVIDKQAEIS